MKKFIEYLKFFLGGLAFGIANVIPGVSGGTMLVVFGIYDRLMESISGIKAILKNFLFLVVFGLGGAVCRAALKRILGFAIVIKSLFDAVEVQTNMFFIGLILGSVPLIVKTGTAESKPKPLCALPFLIALSVVIGLAVLERAGSISIAPDVVDGFEIITTVKLFVCAVIAAVTMIIPGVSGSFVMLLLGVYDTIISAINLSSLNFYVIIPFAIGAVVGIILGAKLISILINKYKLMVYSAIMGLVIGSVYAILPEGFGFNLQTGYGFVCLLAGVVVAILVQKLGSAGESAKE